MNPQPASTAAIVFPAVDEVELREVPLPPLGPEDVLVEVEHTTISAGTELHCLHGTIRLGAGTVRFPFTPGYQAAGRVRAAGDAVSGLAVGDRVFSARCRQPPGWEGGWWAGHCAWHVAAAADVIPCRPRSAHAAHRPCCWRRWATTAACGRRWPPVTWRWSSVTVW